MNAMRFICISIQLLHHLREKKPRDEDDGEPKEYLRKELLFEVLRSSHRRRTRSGLAQIESGREETEGKRTDSERQMETVITQSESIEEGTIRFGPLSGRSRRGILPGILLVTAAPAVEWNNFLPAYRSLAHGTDLSGRCCLQPLVQTRPAEEMSAHADHSILSCVQANVALEVAIISGLFTCTFLLTAVATRAGLWGARAWLCWARARRHLHDENFLCVCV